MVEEASARKSIDGASTLMRATPMRFEVEDGMPRPICSVTPAELALSQRIPFGTTAWRISMGRRQVVESVNAALKGAFVDLARGFFRVFGRVKMTVLLGFTLAAYNLDRIRSFRAKQALFEDKPKPRPKRRRGIWAELVPVADELPLPVDHHPSG